MWTKQRQGYHIIVHQQPERARLCSFKEENETIDRRPVDPPPIVEVYTTDRDSDFMESSTFFLRASLVHSTPDTYGEHLPVITPNRTSATTGEVVQTLEKLQMLDGSNAALCIFAKLSVRMPGIFRLRFSLYSVSGAGVAEAGFSLSDPFEVFSPKQFRGMRESTPFTRHLASQGIKVKLRTDTTAGRASGARRKSTQTPHLVWRMSDSIKYPESRDTTPVGTKYQDDGLVHLLPRTPGPSLDLSAFSLSARDSTSTSSTSFSHSTLVTPLTTPNSRTDSPFPHLGSLRIGQGGDDGIAILPPIFTQPVLPRLYNLVDSHNNVVLPPIRPRQDG